MINIDRIKSNKIARITNYLIWFAGILSSMKLLLLTKNLNYLQNLRNFVIFYIVHFQETQNSTNLELAKLNLFCSLLALSGVAMVKFIRFLLVEFLASHRRTLDGVGVWMVLLNFGLGVSPINSPIFRFLVTDNLPDCSKCAGTGLEINSLALLANLSVLIVSFMSRLEGLMHAIMDTKEVNCKHSFKTLVSIESRYGT